MNRALISVIVISYNSAKFIIETLESIKNQTYDNIEIIVSDDFSNDHTLKVTSDWLKNNRLRFVNSRIIQAEQNTGVAGNCNRGLRFAKGKYIKFIAADDALLPNCIELNYIFAIRNEAQIIHSDRLIFLESFDEKCFLKRTTLEGIMSNNNLAPEIQFEFLLRDNVIGAPTVFFNADLLKRFNGFDERMQMIEDWPMWIRAAKNNIKIFYMNEATVKYRVHSKSVSYALKPPLVFSNLDILLIDFYRTFVLPEIFGLEKFILVFELKRKELLIKYNLVDNNFLNSLLNKITVYPFIKYRWFKIRSLNNAVNQKG